MTNERTLLPCPFCGCEDIRREECIMDSAVWCSSCGAKHRRDNLPNNHGLPVAISNWNRRAAARPAQEPVAWQPIETAPKDGTSILVTDARVIDWTQVVWWDDEAVTDWKWAHSDADGLWHKDSFTHWKPLPAAPSLTGEER